MIYRVRYGLFSAAILPKRLNKDCVRVSIFIDRASAGEYVISTWGGGLTERQRRGNTSKTLEGSTIIYWKLLEIHHPLVHIRQPFIKRIISYYALSRDTFGLVTIILEL